MQNVCIKEKWKIFKNLIFDFVWTSYVLTLANSVTNKSSWLKVIQGCYLAFFNLKSKTDIYSHSLISEWKHLLVKTTVNTIMQYYDNFEKKIELHELAIKLLKNVQLKTEPWEACDLPHACFCLDLSQGMHVRLHTSNNQTWCG